MFDWIVDLGPEGGDKGGKIIFEGTPENLIKDINSITGRYLKKKLKKNPSFRWVFYFNKYRRLILNEFLYYYILSNHSLNNINSF